MINIFDIVYREICNHRLVVARKILADYGYDFYQAVGLIKAMIKQRDKKT